MNWPHCKGEAKERWYFFHVRPTAQYMFLRTESCPENGEVLDLKFNKTQQKRDTAQCVIILFSHLKRHGDFIIMNETEFFYSLYVFSARVPHDYVSHHCLVPGSKLSFWGRREKPPEWEGWRKKGEISFSSASCGFAAHSHFLSRLASPAIQELARRLVSKEGLNIWYFYKYPDRSTQLSNYPISYEDSSLATVQKSAWTIF